MSTDTIIDFTNCEQTKKAYGGANGKKVCCKINGERFMVKTPGQAKINPRMSYANSAICEYLACHILSSLGIDTQETVLGTINIGEKDYIAVGCKDFVPNGYAIQDFASIKNQVIKSGHSGAGTELSEILDTIDQQELMNRDIILNRFWEIFVADALIGNWDRHNGNWGFLYNQETDDLKLAPVFDCGSSLFPQADEEIIKAVLSNKSELHRRVYDMPLSAILENGKKINYYKFMVSTENKDCLRAIIKIVPQINMEKISDIIEQTPFINADQKKFYKTILAARKTSILDIAYERAIDIENNKDNELEDGR